MNINLCFVVVVVVVVVCLFVCFVFQAEELAIKKEELSLEELTARQRSLGNIRFIGELFKLKVLLICDLE